MVNHYFLPCLQATDIDEAFKHSLACIKENFQLDLFIKNSGIFEQLNSDVEENIRRFPMLIKNLFLNSQHNFLSEIKKASLLELFSFESRLSLLQLQSVGLLRHGLDYFILGDHFICDLKFENPYLPSGEWIIFKFENQLKVEPFDPDIRMIFEYVEEGIGLSLLPENTLRKALGLGIILRNKQKK